MALGQENLALISTVNGQELIVVKSGKEIATLTAALLLVRGRSCLGGFRVWSGSYTLF